MYDNEHVEEIALADIHLDRDTQVRLTINEEMVQRYFGVMEDEERRDKFPPILLFRDPEGRLWLADGHHRVMAALRRKFASIRAVIRPGTKEDAIWEAIKANNRNGLPLLGVDIRRAVGMVHAIWPDRSNVLIAEAIGCSEITVRRFRDSISGSTPVEPEKRTGKDGKSYPARKRKKGKLASAKNSAASPKAHSAENKANGASVDPPPEASAEAVAVQEASEEIDRRRAAANAKETQIFETIAQLRIQIDEWFEIAVDDMHEGFDHRIRPEIKKLID